LSTTDGFPQPYSNGNSFVKNELDQKCRCLKYVLSIMILLVITTMKIARNILLQFVWRTIAEQSSQHELRMALGCVIL
jgi:hypothetical protein